MERKGIVIWRKEEKKIGRTTPSTYFTGTLLRTRGEKFLETKSLKTGKKKRRG